MVEKKTSVDKTFWSIYRKVLSATWPNSTVVKYNLKIYIIYYHIKFRESFFNENAGLHPATLQKRLQHRCFPVIVANLLRTPVLKNNCKRLFERFPTWINNISTIWIEEDIFSKTKQSKNYPKTQLDEKKLSFSWWPSSFRFSRFLQCMSGGRSLSCIIKDDSSEEL